MKMYIFALAVLALTVLALAGIALATHTAGCVLCSGGSIPSGSDCCCNSYDLGVEACGTSGLVGCKFNNNNVAGYWIPTCGLGKMQGCMGGHLSCSAPICGPSGCNAAANGDTCEMTCSCGNKAWYKCACGDTDCSGDGTCEAACAGGVCTTTTHEIKGAIFVDTNLNGVKDIGEGCYSGSFTVSISGTSSQTQTHNQASSCNEYRFTGLSSGTYDVTYAPIPTGYGPTSSTTVRVTIS